MTPPILIRNPSGSGIQVLNKMTILTITTPTLTPGDTEIFCDTASNDITLNLSQIAIDSYRVLIKKIHANNKIVLTGSIDGTTNPELRGDNDFVILTYSSVKGKWFSTGFFSNESDLAYCSNDTVSTGSVIDVTGMALTLGKGIWRVWYDAVIRIHRSAGAMPHASIFLANSSNTRHDQTGGRVYFADLTTGNSHTNNASGSMKLTATIPTIVKARLYANSDEGRILVSNSGSRTDATASIINATRIGL